MTDPVVILATAALLLSGFSLWRSFLWKPPQAPAPEILKPAPFVELVQRSGRNLGPRTDVEEQPIFLSTEQRREKIASLASDPEYLEKVKMLTKSHLENSGLIPPDPEAQSNHAAWRIRQQRGNR
jgi:hypothetical protein